MRPLCRMFSTLRGELPNNEFTRQLVLITRHGDRSPTFNPFFGTKQEQAYLQQWKQQVAVSSPELDMLFPVLNSNEKCLDDGCAPLQSLTKRGAEQCRRRGQQVGSSYSDFLRQCAENRRILLKASNFERTQLSCKYLMQAALERANAPLHDVALPIHVDDFRRDKIAVFDSENGLAAAMRAVFAEDIYVNREKELRHIARQLVQHIPYFKPDLPHFLAEEFDYLALKKFLWIRAFDLLESTKAHGHTLAAEVAALDDAIHDHLLWRFLTLLAYPHILRLSVGALVQEIHENMLQVVQGYSSPQVAMYSGHDVTVLPMAFFLSRCSASTHVDNMAQLRATSKWPAYASQIEMALVCDSSAEPAVNWRFITSPPRKFGDVDAENNEGDVTAGGTISLKDFTYYVKQLLGGELGPTT